MIIKRKYRYGDHKRRILREKVTKTTQFIVKRFLVYHLKPFYENKDTSMSNVGKLYESVIGTAVLMALVFTKLFLPREIFR